MALRFFLVALLSTCICACGWQLRGYEQHKAAGAKKIERIHLRTSADNRLFQASLRRLFNDMSISLDPEAELKLVLGAEHTERRPLSYGSTGIPVQYQLIMTIKYAYANAGQQTPVDKKLVARRQYDFDTELVVAKNEEERQLLQEMREELAARIIASIDK